MAEIYKHDIAYGICSICKRVPAEYVRVDLFGNAEDRCRRHKDAPLGEY